MKAMILAAGLGTRLRPLTNDRPKALVEINGRTLLEITVARLAAFGVTDIIVNVHHFADSVVSCLKAKNNFGLRIEVSREDDMLLDTGGALKKAAWFFLNDGAGQSTAATHDYADEPFLLHNVDVISNIDFSRMLEFHKENHALATLAVQARPSSRQLLFDVSRQLCGRRTNGQDSIIPGEAKNPSQPANDETITASSQSLLQPLAFSGIHVLSPRLLPLLTETIPVFSIIDSYLRLTSQGYKILAFGADQYYWRDLGRPSDLAHAAEDFRQERIAL